MLIYCASYGQNNHVLALNLFTHLHLVTMQNLANNGGKLWKGTVLAGVSPTRASNVNRKYYTSQCSHQQCIYVPNSLHGAGLHTIWPHYVHIELAAIAHKPHEAPEDKGPPPILQTTPYLGCHFAFLDLVLAPACVPRHH